jgi:2-amino-4-hydroxy-6-hydroxymethyldihydropteridine diphosphokinase
MDLVEVALGLGANLTNPVAQLFEAVRRLSAVVRITAVSSVYCSEPMGYREQPDFFNIVCMGRTEIPGRDLLSVAQRIESELERTRSFRDAPRTIDIDILTYGNLVLDTPSLSLPHPRLHQRAFVLVPLADIAPEWRHPVFGKTAAELLAEAGPLERIERVGPLPG